MRSVTGIGVVLAIALFLAGSGLAEHGGHEALPEGSQMTCPVGGMAIDKEVFVDYQGARVYFCCDMCPKEFMKNPDRYLKEMEEKGIIQEKAPQPSHQGHETHG